MDLPSWLQDKKPGETNRLRLLLYLAVVVALVLVGMWVTDLADTSDRGPSDVEVRNQCREWAKDQLVAPADAEFSGETVTGDGPWTVTGTIDAPNRLGVTIRLTYSCDIRQVGNTWRGEAVVSE